MSDPVQVRCFKHYCQQCHTLYFVKIAEKAEYPRCCSNKATAYLGIVDAVPSRDETLKKRLQK